MKIEVRVKPNAKRTEVKLIEPGVYSVAVQAPPMEGKANEAVREALSGFFEVPKSRITILRGDKGKKKLVEISRA